MSDRVPSDVTAVATQPSLARFVRRLLCLYTQPLQNKRSELKESSGFLPVGVIAVRVQSVRDRGDDLDIASSTEMGSRPMSVCLAAKSELVDTGSISLVPLCTIAF